MCEWRLQNERVSCWFPIGSVRERKKESDHKEAYAGRWLNDTFAGTASLSGTPIEMRVGGEMSVMKVIERGKIIRRFWSKSEALVSDQT